MTENRRRNREIRESGCMGRKTEDRAQMTEDSKIRAKSTPRLPFSMLAKLLYNCRGSSTNQPCFFQNKANFRKGQNVRNRSSDKGL